MRCGKKTTMFSLPCLCSQNIVSCRVCMQMCMDNWYVLFRYNRYTIVMDLFYVVFVWKLSEIKTTRQPFWLTLFHSHWDICLNCSFFFACESHWNIRMSMAHRVDSIDAVNVKNTTCSYSMHMRIAYVVLLFDDAIKRKNGLIKFNRFCVTSSFSTCSLSHLLRSFILLNIPTVVWLRGKSPYKVNNKWYQIDMINKNRLPDILYYLKTRWLFPLCNKYFPHQQTKWDKSVGVFIIRKQTIPSSISHE